MPRGRVLFLTSNLPRWAGDSTTPFVLNLAQDLVALGWDVRILAPHAPGALRRETLDGVSIERFRYFVPESFETLCYQGGSLINLQRNRGNALKIPFFVACEWAATMRAMIRSRPDLVHSHWVLPQGFVAALATAAARIPHVATAHGSDVFALNGYLMRQCKRIALSGADTITVNSSATREAVARIAPAITRVAQIPMGAGVDENPDLSAVQALRAQHARGHGPLLIFVGRLAEEKGVADLIRAVSVLSVRLPDLTALVVGEGPDRPMLEQLANQLGVAGRVIFTGWIQQREIAVYLRAADIFVGPSKRTADGRMEAQGLSFVEAMLAGIPVIAGDVGGVTDLVRPGRTGLLIRPGAVNEIAASVERLYRDRELADRLRREALELARRVYTREASARAFSALYDQVLRQGRRGIASAKGAASGT